MRLEIDGWKLDVDISGTMAHSAAEAKDHCLCGYCRNFYASVDTAYPGLRAFLAEFGLDVEGPAELFPYEATVCEAAYLVKGSILSAGNCEVDIDNAHILFSPIGEVSVPGPIPEGDWFVLQVMDLFLPWVLEEPMEDVASPANAPSFLRRMWQKLLGKGKDGCVS